MRLNRPDPWLVNTHDSMLYFVYFGVVHGFLLADRFADLSVPWLSVSDQLQVLLSCFFPIRSDFGTPFCVVESINHSLQLFSF